LQEKSKLSLKTVDFSKKCEAEGVRKVTPMQKQQNKK
jgi:hypothetical protein